MKRTGTGATKSIHNSLCGLALVYWTSLWSHVEALLKKINTRYEALLLKWPC